MRKYLLVVVLAAIIGGVGCGANAVSSSSTNNSEIKVDLLFEHDGCKVYRFYDYGYERYYAVCREAAQATVSTEHTQGKSTVYDETPTVKKCD